MTDIPKPRFTGIFIPVEILELEDLTLLEMLLISWIDALYSKEYGGCYASNEYLAIRLKVQVNTIAKALTSLRQKKLIEDVSFDGRTRVIKSLIYSIIHKNQSKSELDRQSNAELDKNPTPIGEKSNPPVKPYIYESKEERKDKNIAQSRAKRGHEQDDFFFDHEKKDFSGITEKDMAEWKQLFPFLDIPSELLRAKQWILGNPTKAKKKLWRKFLIGWFQRNNDHQENKKAYRSNFKSQEEIKAPDLDFLKEILKRNNAWKFIKPPNNGDNLIKVKIGEEWIKISTFENALEDQVMNALYKGGHL